MSTEEEVQREKDIKTICESLISKRSKPQLRDSQLQLIRIPSEKNPN